MSSTLTPEHTSTGLSTAPPRGLVAMLTVAAFLTFAQAFMIAPILPQLARAFHSTPESVGLAVPAYLVPYGVLTLLWGPLSDRVGRRPVILGSLAAFTVLTAATALADGNAAFLTMRLFTGIGVGGVVPVALALIGDVFPYAQRGRALGWMYGGMAGGIAVGSSAGALAEPLIGWPGLFLAVAAASAVLLLTALTSHVLPTAPRPETPLPLAAVAAGYRSLLGSARGRRTYGYILFNAILHSGIYTWLGLYLIQRFALGPVGIGLALLGYGIPGLLLGPVIGGLADRYGRARIIPAGVALAAICALLLATDLPLPAAALTIAALSLGYDMTHPLLAGIVTALPRRPDERGQALGLNSFCLFTGFGLGSLAFELLLPTGFTTALTIFGAAALTATLTAIPAFRSERAH
ncbi:MFS transporter [Streptomyces sp. NPDC002104]